MASLTPLQEEIIHSLKLDPINLNSPAINAARRNLKDQARGDGETRIRDVVPMVHAQAHSQVPSPTRPFAMRLVYTVTASLDNAGVFELQTLTDDSGNKDNKTRFYLFIGAVVDSVGPSRLSLWLDSAFGPLVVIAEDYLGDPSKRPKARFSRAMESMKRVRTLRDEPASPDLLSGRMLWTAFVGSGFEEAKTVPGAGLTSWTCQKAAFSLDFASTYVDSRSRLFSASSNFPGAAFVPAAHARLLDRRRTYDFCCSSVSPAQTYAAPSSPKFNSSTG
ncbi:hypothetical protein C8R44DRAFT_849244 [Mycena epipterygia]|nr:hypothetical protein C8R44DRAFT_849244 [Mycena epipterygia]